jgi:addiction module RelE/StbE family toxin
MKIIWSPLAISRVSEIGEYILRDNPSAAEKWVNEIFNRVLQLKKYPESGRILPELELEEIRELIYGNYRIIYRIKKEAIVILTVRHGRQILPEEDLK